ncbi:DapH/DapD/GlmU-related protein [Sporomusa aerivorans]|uniref:DapH/DapD/GlmU-related protein n=1 Tax=Sporomusa aerivorans TaxID=204936 RepID=UPI00352BCE68
MELKKACLDAARDLYLRARIWLFDLLSDGDVMGEPNILHPSIFTGPGKVAFGQNVRVGIRHSPYFWSGNNHFDTRRNEAMIEIGNNVAINNNFTAICLANITVGDDTLIGFNVTIMDFDAHGVEPHLRRGNPGKSAAVNIGRNCWIGSNVAILKGVSIGDNSIIGLGSVVTGSIPANVIAAGNPCQVVREIHVI